MKDSTTRQASLGTHSYGGEADDRNTGRDNNGRDIETPPKRSKKAAALDRSTEFFIAGEDMAHSGFAQTGLAKTGGTHRPSVFPWTELSPFPHCVLPDHFFERFREVNYSEVD